MAQSIPCPGLADPPVEMVLLVGDGIIGPDPVSVLAVRPNGDLVANGEASSGVRPLSDCRVIDIRTGEVIEFDPDGFEVLFRMPTDLRGPELWEIEAFDLDRGITRRPATRREYLQSHLQGRTLAGMVASAVIAVPSAVGLAARPWWARVLAGAWFVAAFLAMTFVAGFFLTTDLQYGLNLASMLATAGLPALLLRLARRRTDPP